MVTLKGGTYCTISEIAKEMNISRQRLHIIAKNHGIVGTRVANNFTLYNAVEAEKIIGILTREKIRARV